MEGKLYTVGYAGRSLADVETLVVTQQALLVDIRYSPRSRMPDFTKIRLVGRFGIRYRHVPALGNTNYKAGPIALADYPRGLQTVRTFLKEHPVLLLMCVCRNVQTCHRRTVAEALSDDLDVPHYHLEHILREPPGFSHGDISQKEESDEEGKNEGPIVQRASGKHTSEAVSAALSKTGKIDTSNRERHPWQYTATQKNGDT